MNEPANEQVRAAPPRDAAVSNAERGLPAFHLRFGWTALLVFATLGLVLEGLHAYKSPAYLGVDQEVRRLMWTLAHAHGVGLSLLHIGFAFTAERLGGPTASDARRRRLALGGKLLCFAIVLLPLGFFLGGIGAFEGDPGVGVFLAPVGALCTWAAILLVAMVTSERS